jgi:hypothetical protein
VEKIEVNETGSISDRSSSAPNNVSLDIGFTPRPEDEDSEIFGNLN